MSEIDPKDRGFVVQVSVEDQFVPPSVAERQALVVRVLRHLPVPVRDVPLGVRVRPLASGLSTASRTHVRAYVVYAATYTRYEATRITRALVGRYRDQTPVRVSVVRALMHSVQLPQVKETVEYEEATAIWISHRSTPYARG